MSFVLLLFLACSSSRLCLRLRGRHALFPPEGEEQKSEKRVTERHLRWRLAPARRRRHRRRPSDGLSVSVLAAGVAQPVAQLLARVVDRVAELPEGVAE